jgi:zinc protease
MALMGRRARRSTRTPCTPAIRPDLEITVGFRGFAMFLRPCSRLFSTSLAGVVLSVALLGGVRAVPAQSAPFPAAPSLPGQAAAPVTLEVRRIQGVTEYRLSNGLQVLLAPDDARPTTTVNLTVRVGSRHESYGETGMAHLLEHMLFKGSARHPQPWAEFARRGFRANGTTSADRTNYYATFAADEGSLRWLLDWMADAMVDSFVAREALDTEMTVVRNEMEMGENSPGRMLMQRTLAAMYGWHNYGKSTIGARSDVEGVDIERLRAFYRTWYRPDNATLIVTGRFDPRQVLEVVTATFGQLQRPAHPLPTLPTLEDVQDGEREVVLRRPGGSPSLLLAYHGVPAAHPDQAPLEMLGAVMGDVPSGRLHRRLTEQRLAASTWGWVASRHDPGFIVFGARLSPGQDVETARRMLLEVVESAAAEPISAAELERARRRWLNAWDDVSSRPERLASVLSEAVAQGDWRLFYLARERVRAVSLDDVARVAAERLVPSNRTLGRFVPTPEPVRAPVPARVDVAVQVAALAEGGAMEAVEPFAATPDEIELRVRRGRIGGLDTAFLSKQTRAAAVRGTLRLRIGDEQSLRGFDTTAEMMAALLGRGTATMNRQQVQDRLDALRAGLSFGYGMGVLSVGFEARRDTLPEVLELAMALLREPAFDAAALEELRGQSLASLAAARTEPGAMLANALERHGNPHPRGDPRHARSFDEIESDLRSVRVEDLRAFHARFVGAAHGVFAAVGDFDAPDLEAQIARGLGDWRAPEPAARVAQVLALPSPTRIVVDTPDKANATLRLRQTLPLSDRHEDHAAMVLGTYLLGQGGQSRLWKRVREREGLSYDVGAWMQWNAWEAVSLWQARAIAAPANISAVEAAMREEIERVLREGFDEREVAEAKEALLAFRRLSMSQDATLVSMLASQAERGETMARTKAALQALETTTAEQVNAALRRHLRPEEFVLGVAGAFGAATPAAPARP